MTAAELISLYDTLFNVSLCIALLGLGLSVFLFFYFDIRTVYALMTGKAKQETIRRMAEQNAKTGNLRNQYLHTGPTGRTGKTGKSGPLGFTGSLTEQIAPTPVQQAVEPETAVLVEDVVMETNVLNAASAQTVETAVLSTPANQFRFLLTENTLVIHTDEII